MEHITWLHKDRRAEPVKIPLYYFVMTTEGKKKKKKKVVRTYVCHSPANLSASRTDFSGNTNLLVGPPAAAHSLLAPDC